MGDNAAINGRVDPLFAKDAAMARAWNPDDKIFVLVLMAAAISQTATSKNFVGATAKATMAFFERTANEPAAVRQRKPVPVQAIRRLSPLLAGTAAFFKATVAKIAKREPTAKPRTPSTVSFLHRSWHVSPQKPQTATSKTWRTGLDRLHWPWKKRTRTSALSLPTDPRIAGSLQPSRS
jgi:hypothetical protein